jgi:hypothetical protein
MSMYAIVTKTKPRSKSPLVAQAAATTDSSSSAAATDQGKSGGAEGTRHYLSFLMRAPQHHLGVFRKLFPPSPAITAIALRL